MATAQARPPSVDRLLRAPAAQPLILAHGRTATVDALRSVLAAWRAGRRDDGAAASPEMTEAILAAADRLLADRARPSLRRVFNLTGTVLHTNLGRAVLAEEAIAAVTQAMRHAVTLEYDLATGQRGERDDHVAGLLTELTGAEDALIVNNNAAAVLLVLSTLAGSKEAIVSRGELIEIGGSFRLPEIMRRAGARLREVGTTNRTHLPDIEEAIGPRTGLVMKVHTSNYVVQGFTAMPPARAVAALCHARGVPFVDDLGSGTLIDLARYGLRHERTVQDALRDGADLVTFSGDKLLGGPQVGIIAGRADLVRRCRKNHLKRALRADKLRLAALEATLRLYRDPDRLAARVPTLRFFTADRAALMAEAERLVPGLRHALGPVWQVAAIACDSQIGSGALPIESLPSAGLAIRAAGKPSGRRLQALAAALRALPIPVIGRIADDAVILDLRCLDDAPAFTAQLSALGAP
jgi:L-seryl-tRNA(Ser) seleniumtransferase